MILMRRGKSFVYPIMAHQQDETDSLKSLSRTEKREGHISLEVALVSLPKKACEEVLAYLGTLTDDEDPKSMIGFVWNPAAVNTFLLQAQIQRDSRGLRPLTE